MGFYLTKAVLARSAEIEITRAERDSIIAAWQALSLVGNIEEEWDALVQNYLELELELLKTAMQSMVFNHESHDELMQIRLGFSRRLSNLLHSCRSYLDHTPHHLRCLGTTNAKQMFKEFASTAYDSHFGYRFMEALRNHSQHRGLPLHGYSFHASWLGDIQDEQLRAKARLRHSVTASISVKRIRQDDKFPAKILVDLTDDQTSLDVATLTREYIEALSNIHTSLRQLLSPLEGIWLSSVRNTIARYAAANDGDVFGLAVVEMDNERNFLSETHIFEEMLQRIERLRRRNAELKNLRRRYVSNEIIIKN